jgi:hypothetical protein
MDVVHSPPHKRLRARKRPLQSNWLASESPEETWSDAEGRNDIDQWPVKGVVGEELDSDKNSM